jgi:hypothetical protein
MSTTTYTVAGVDAYEHGYTTAHSFYSGANDATYEVQLANVVSNLGITGPALADWTDGVHDAQADLDDEARRAQLQAAGR